MKVIFLDIDGVLNSDDLARTRIKEGLHEYSDDEYTFIDSNAVRIVTNMCEKYGVRIVMSSSWRLWTLEETIKYHDTPRYKRLRPILKYLVGVTPHIYKENEDGSSIFVERGYEIKKYLENHPEIKEYVIIDDDSDMLPEQMNNFIQTNFLHGLTSEHVPRIKNILKLN